MPGDEGKRLVAPSEGEASTPAAIADELSDALLAFDHVDYNALTVAELEELLAARETVEEVCLRYRRQQSGHGAPAAATDGGEEVGDRVE